MAGFDSTIAVYAFTTSDDKRRRGAVEDVLLAET